jgi:hydroxypyruvate isomerase
LKQSVIHWCFKDYWDVEQTAEGRARHRPAQRRAGRPAALADAEEVRPHCAIAGSHGFVKGMNNPGHWPSASDICRQRIDAAPRPACRASSRSPACARRDPDDVGAKNCVEGYKKIVGHAEKKNVTLCLEMLNSRVHVHR